MFKYNKPIKELGRNKQHQWDEAEVWQLTDDFVPIVSQFQKKPAKTITPKPRYYSWSSLLVTLSGKLKNNNNNKKNNLNFDSASQSTVGQFTKQRDKLSYTQKPEWYKALFRLSAKIQFSVHPNSNQTALNIHKPH